MSDGTSQGTKQITDFAAPEPFRVTEDVEVFDGVAYFLVDDVVGGTDLWRSDGTAAGTRRVTDFGFATPFEGLHLAKAGNRLIFVANDGLTGKRFWTSLGTPSTVAPLAGCTGDCPVPASFSDITMTSLSGRVFFAASTSARGLKLWSTDGTGPGTRLVRDLCPGSCSSEPRRFSELEGKLLFVTGDFFRITFWLTDGTANGTRRLTPEDRDLEIPEGSGIIKAGTSYFFVGNGAERERQLWVSDGTPQGAHLVTLFGGGGGSNPSQFVELGQQLLFTTCFDDGFDPQFWSSDGTREGTSALSLLSGCSSNTDFVKAGSLIFFLNNFGEDLWRTDGTVAGTFLLKGETFDESIGSFTSFGQELVFFVHGDVGSSLWTSNGTLAGTRKLFDWTGEGFPDHLTSAGSRLYFVSNQRLWVSDGSAAGTRPLTSEGSDSGRVTLDRPPVRVENLLFFTTDFADDLWVTDGTPAGTRPVHDPATNAGRFSRILAEFDGALYYVANAAGDGGGLWRTDGTALGTVFLRELGFSSENVSFTPMGDLAFFVAFDSEHGTELWRTDGTAGGTVLVRDIANSGGSPEPFALTVAGSLLFFTANDGEHGRELWRTDGTAEGTVLVRDIKAGEDSSEPASLLAAGGKLFFVANDGTHGTELWESDGTPGGTHMVQDLAPGEASSGPRELTATTDFLFFSANDGFSGREPWVYPLNGPSSCVPSDEVLCLGGGRFKVVATWRDFEGRTGRGHGVSLTSDTGYFWFFDPANVEAILKVLDGRGVNGHHWAFYGALSNVEYVLTVTDTQTGATRRYVNPPGVLASVGDTHAFGPLGATGSALSLGPQGITADLRVTEGFAGKAGNCAPSSTRLCLSNGRFAVEANWKDFDGVTGTGKAVPLSGGDTGYFWFFGEENVEVVLKVLDGRALNGKFWVFYGALSNVEYTLKVTDTETGQVRPTTIPRAGWRAGRMSGRSSASLDLMGNPPLGAPASRRPSNLFFSFS